MPRFEPTVSRVYVSKGHRPAAKEPQDHEVHYSFVQRGGYGLNGKVEVLRFLVKGAPGDADRTQSPAGEPVTVDIEALLGFVANRVRSSSKEQLDQATDLQVLGLEPRCNCAKETS